MFEVYQQTRWLRVSAWGRLKMTFDLPFAQRVRTIVAGDIRFTEKKMFGGIGFLLCGNMCVGIWKENLILRVGKIAWEETLQRENVVEFNITGRSMTGWVMVEPDGFDNDQQLKN